MATSAPALTLDRTVMVRGNVVRRGDVVIYHTVGSVRGDVVTDITYPHSDTLVIHLHLANGVVMSVDMIRCPHVHIVNRSL